MEWLERTDTWLMGGALVALLGIGSSLVARRFGAPLLLVFLGLGVALGPEGAGFAIAPGLVYAIGALALAIILFDGGLQTRLAPLRAAIAPALWLATAGVAATALLTAFAAMWLLDLGFAEGLLLGAVLASTDAAAVFFLLRGAGISLPKRINGVLEIESGSNDPAAVFLTLTLCTWLALGGAGGRGEAEVGALALATQLALAVGLGIGLGVAGGRLIALGLNRLALPEGLHPLFALAGAVGVFAATNHLGGSGFLAVYVAGLVLGQGRVRAIANVTTVMVAATWLAQGGMFLLLGLLVVPSRLLDVLGPALALAAVLMLVARPLVVAACLAPFGFAKREIGFIGWVGLRGAVGVFLATLPMLMDLPDAEVYFNVAFVVVVVSLLVQGWTLKPAARLFGVALPRRETSTRRIELDLPGQLDYEIVGYHVGPTSAILSKKAELPGWARPAMVVRDEAILLPHESGALRPGDTAYYLAPKGTKPARRNARRSAHSACPATCRSANSRGSTACRSRRATRPTPRRKCSPPASRARFTSATASGSGGPPWWRAASATGGPAKSASSSTPTRWGVSSAGSPGCARRWADAAGSGCRPRIPLPSRRRRDKSARVLRCLSVHVTQ